MKMLNPADILKIGVLSFIFIWGANRLIEKTGLSDLTTS